jgi:cyclophilin family peptidyl-prolyl cis-trans isomerase
MGKLKLSRSKLIYFRKHVVFGQVVDGLKVVKMIENISIGPNSKPTIPCVIAECGQL